MPWSSGVLWQEAYLNSGSTDHTPVLVLCHGEVWLGQISVDEGEGGGIDVAVPPLHADQVLCENSEPGLSRFHHSLRVRSWVVTQSRAGCNQNEQHLRQRHFHCPAKSFTTHTTALTNNQFLKPRDWSCPTPCVYICKNAMMEPASHLACAASSLLFFVILHASALNSDPSPNPSSVVQIGKARFTILTSHLVRMEWGSKVDAATFVFLNRNLPKPNFTVSKDQDWHVIQTSAVKVRSKDNNIYHCIPIIHKII